MSQGLETIIVGMCRNYQAIKLLRSPKEFVVKRIEEFRNSDEMKVYTSSGVSASDRIRQAVPLGEVVRSEQGMSFEDTASTERAKRVRSLSNSRALYVNSRGNIGGNCSTANVAHVRQLSAENGHLFMHCLTGNRAT